MMFGMLWQRYFLKEIAKVFFLFLLCFYILYVIVDYSVHFKTLQQVSFHKAAFYYLCHFSKRTAILVPFALLLATIKTLSQWNLRHELVALLVGGISTRKLLQPFLLVALLSTAYIYLNYEKILPASLAHIQTFDDSYIEGTNTSQEKLSLYSATLPDHSLILYQSFILSKRMLYDVYWIRSQEEVYRIKELYLAETPPRGTYVDHLFKDSEGRFQKKKSMHEYHLEEMQIDEEILQAVFTLPEHQSISQLWSEQNRWARYDPERLAMVQTWLSYKCLMPWICFLAVLGPAPFCMRFGRHLPLFFIYSVSIFALVTLFTLLDAAIVLGESQSFSPFFVIATPILIAFAGIGCYFLFRK